MSRKRTNKTTTSSSSSSTHPIHQTPSASTSTTSIPSQTTDINRHAASVAGSTMSKSATSALEATASVVHKVKTQVPETLQAVSKSIPQTLPQNLTRWTGAKATASTQVVQDTAGRSSSVSASSSKSPKSISPMSKHLSPSKPTTQLTGLTDDAKTKEDQTSEVETRIENGKPQDPGASDTNGVGKDVDISKGDSTTATSEAPAPVEQKNKSSYWLPWWGSSQGAPPADGRDATPSPEVPPTAPEPVLPPPSLPVIENLKADNKTLLKVKSAENLGMKKALNSSSASIKTAPPTLINTPVIQPTSEEALGSSLAQPLEQVPIQPAAPQRSSWFGMWGYGGTANVPEAIKGGTAPEDNEPASEPIQTAEAVTANSPAAPQTNGTAVEPTPEAPIPDPQTKPAPSEGILARGAAWVFWSKPQPQPEAGQTTEIGDIAIAGSSSELEPQKAQITTETPLPATTTPRKKSSKKDLAKSPAAASSASVEQPPSIPVAPKEVSPAAKTLQKVLPPNLLVPSFESCYNLRQSSTWFGSVSRLWSAPKALSRNQLYLTPLPPRIRKAVAIGVHGFFPMKILQRVLGEPTGTSVRFATAGAAAIQRWAEKHNLSVDIEKIALEGEGRVSDRVEMLWKLLENRLDIIQRADFILVCCHSQGTPVGVHLVARMIEYGLVDRAKIGIIGMAGINLGPFGELNSRILTGSARELFDFSSPTSLASQQYIESLTAVLAHGVKLVFVGSIDDQLVSLYSSTFSNISHPFIYRAVFVDGRVHAPDFISHVVGLALKLRNIGVRDHGIIRELSGPLAGSLYSGEGHSRIYDDAAIYDLGVRHALETSTKEYLRVPLKVEDFQLPSASNPYILPWAMRGMLEEKRVQDELREEAQVLLEEFAKWTPTSKQLKDVK
ncbi:hypothetical protein ABW19_dt0200133 [Dactylella cylindrospora]|nr:hypothetical protein ABW19_dt0200133 [Dactylella cylindrospora]